jgi:hypothetical protein
VGCSGSKEAEDVLADASASDAESETVAYNCDPDNVPATTLECTGLYANIAKKALAKGVEAYAPSTPLWSDGAEKERWILLPEGEKIDATDPNEWKFPVGTKLWKQFSWKGKRVETRLWQKVRPTFWVKATYAWGDDDTTALQSKGGDIFLASGDSYHIPTADECEDCHRGRSDRILGFEQPSLGLPGATGYTLPKLVADDRISPAPKSTALEIGDDGTGVAGPAMAWLHVNCGVCCHNDNPSAGAYGAKMRLRLDPTQLDGRSSENFDTRTTTIGVKVNAPSWHDRTRIIPGDPANSLLIALITNRGKDNPEGTQMPPIASRIVDPDGIAKVTDWIRKMGPAPTDGGTDAAPPTPVKDASPDVSVPPPDARVPDAAPPVTDSGRKIPDGGAPSDGGLDASADASD